jgi:SAM-dependent methyltransferase
MASVDELISLHKFRPTFLSLLFNPYFIERSRLFYFIKKNSHYMCGRMLDFGCGAKPYKSLFQVREYIGLDVENSGHSHVLESIDVFYDGVRIPFKNNYFDSVLSSQVFEHVQDVDSSLREISRVVKKGGRCLFTVPFLGPEHEMPNDYRRYTCGGVEKLLLAHGFKIITLQRTTNFIESWFQLICIFISKIFYSKCLILNLILKLVFVFPFTLLGLVVGYLIRFDTSLYLDSVILAEKM